MKKLVAILSFFVCLGVGLQACCATLPGACGDNSAKLDVLTQNHPATLPAPNPNSATLVFVQRNIRCIGCSISRVGLDGAWIGADKGNSYFSFAAAPGVHHVCAYWDAPLAKLEDKVGLTDFTAQAGQIYYFEIEVALRGPEDAPTMRLKPLSPDMGAFLVSRSKQSVMAAKAN
jgi:hypothetical protein